jgi:hypothetical protein
MSRLPRPRTLWQRNLIAAVVLVAALATYWATEIRADFSDYRHNTVPEHVVPAGGSLTVDGVTWKVWSVRHLNGASRPKFAPLPEGAVLEVVIIERAGAQPSKNICNGIIADGERRWIAETPGYLPAADGIVTTCAQPGPIQFEFVLPRDAVPTAVDVVAFDRQIIVRMEL